MRKEYDFSIGERGKFYGKVDTKNPIVEIDDEIDDSFLIEIESLIDNSPPDIQVNPHDFEE